MDKIIKPMLAKSYDKFKHKIMFPCIVQPKLDGIRCLAYRAEDDTIVYYSRTGKKFSGLQHLDGIIRNIIDIGATCDGELYTHDISFQDICSIVRREDPDADKTQLEYWIYDVVDTNKDYISRLGCILTPLFRTKVMTWKELDRYHDQFIEMGYEGSIVRNVATGYEIGKRTANLLKRKDFIDEEYPIVDVVEGKGKFKGCAILVLSTTDGSTFAATSPGDIPLKKKYWRDKDSLIGTTATIKYQNRTDDGIPRFPVCIGLRDYE